MSPTPALHNCYSHQARKQNHPTRSPGHHRPACTQPVPDAEIKTVVARNTRTSEKSAAGLDIGTPRIKLACAWRRGTGRSGPATCLGGLGAHDMSRQECMRLGKTLLYRSLGWQVQMAIRSVLTYVLKCGALGKPTTSLRDDRTEASG